MDANQINDSSAEEILISDLKDKTIADTGLNSIGLVELISEFENEFNCNVDLKVIAEATSLSDFFKALYNEAYTDTKS